MNYSVKIQNALAFGRYNIVFEKSFTMSFAPFYGMTLLDGIQDAADPSAEKTLVEICLVNNNYVTAANITTDIHYSLSREEFFVYVQKNLKYPPSDETIDEFIDSHVAAGWCRTDNTDITAMKETGRVRTLNPR